MKLLFLLSLVTTGFLWAQRNSLRPTLNAQYERIYSIGGGLEYGRHQASGVKLKFRQKNMMLKKRYAFKGVRLTVNKLLNDSGMKSGLSFVTSNFFVAGIELNYLRYQAKHYFYARPLIGISVFNISLLYGYSFFIRNNKDINKHGVALYYSVKLKK